MHPVPLLDPATWPYPRWIAHRGAGHLAPENTLAAFRLGQSYGYRMFECDVRLSADGIPFLLHDDDLERTTDGHGSAAACDWLTLARLDAGAWHSSAFCGESLARLQEVIDFCHRTDAALNVELKPAGGAEHETGRVVAAMLARDWRGALPPLLSSFRVEALRGARSGAPDLPRALLLEQPAPDSLDVAQGLACVAIVVDHLAITPSFAAEVRAAGFALLSYTVNDDAEALRLLQWGVQGLITDRVDHFDPTALTG